MGGASCVGGCEWVGLLVGADMCRSVMPNARMHGLRTSECMDK